MLPQAIPLLRRGFFSHDVDLIAHHLHGGVWSSLEVVIPARILRRPTVESRNDLIAIIAKKHHRQGVALFAFSPYMVEQENTVAKHTTADFAACQPINSDMSA